MLFSHRLFSGKRDFVTDSQSSVFLYVDCSAVPTAEYKVSQKNGTIFVYLITSKKEF